MLSPGAKIDDRYEILAALGSGGVGHVHRARRIRLGDEVAVRVRFLLEARTLQVAHPSLLQVRDFGEDDRSVYLVTDLVDGPSLRQAMAECGPMPWPRVATLLNQALGAITMLHSRGGFICGVNPDMIRIRANQSSDATAGRFADEQIVISSAGIKSVQDVLATMREQELRGQEASENDQLVTGDMPFKAASIPELIGRMLQARPAPPGSIPDAARDAIMKALDSAPAHRFESVDAFARALA